MSKNAIDPILAKDQLMGLQNALEQWGVVIRDTSFWSGGILSSSGCLEWYRCRDKDGYGLCGKKIAQGKYKTTRVPRLAWEYATGRMIPTGLQVLHTCDNPACFLPSHLFLGTNYDNVTDRLRKGRGRNLRGEEHASSKVTALEVTAIRYRRMYLKTCYAVLGRHYGLSYVAIRKIVKRRTWKSVR